MKILENSKIKFNNLSKHNSSHDSDNNEMQRSSVLATPPNEHEFLAPINEYEKENQKISPIVAEALN